MTRSDFEDNITLFYELRDFCSEQYISILDEYFDEDDLDENVCDDIQYADYSWRELRDALRSVPDGYDFYRREGYFDYIGCSEADFEDLKEDVLRIMDERDGWDPEEDEEDEDDEYDEDDETQPEEYVYIEPVVEDPNKDVKLGEFFELPMIGG